MIARPLVSSERYGCATGTAACRRDRLRSPDPIGLAPRPRARTAIDAAPALGRRSAADRPPVGRAFEAPEKARPVSGVPRRASLARSTVSRCRRLAFDMGVDLPAAAVLFVRGGDFLL